MVKVVYTDGSSEIFEAKDVFHNSDRRLFVLQTEKQGILIPEHSVRSVGIGNIETIVTEKHSNGFEVIKEVFVYE